MGRGVVLIGALLAMGLEPVVMPEQDMTRFAITQGGITVIALGMLWYIRQMHKDRLEEKERAATVALAEKDQRLADKDERLQVMVDLVADIKVAFTNSLNAIGNQSKSIENQSKTIENLMAVVQRIDERKNARS